jgi:ParB family chromosome partitioning protein
MLQPVVVRPKGRSDADGYELIMGERRWRASQQAGLDAIPAIVRDTPDDALLRDALRENLHRHDLNPLEEAAAYEQLLQEFGVTHDELAARIGRSRPHVSNTIRLLHLPAPVQRRVAAGVLSAGHARALLGLDQPLAQEELAARIVAEGLSVRAVEEIVKVGDGDARRPQRASRPRGEKPVEAINAELSLTERLDTQVTVAIGKGKGSITIGFADVDDLVRIATIINGLADQP